VSKGFDIQANIQATQALAIDATFGYTDARYTTNAYPSGAVVTPGGGVSPLVYSGDAIGGPGGTGVGYSIPPWTATMGVEYRFNVLEHDSFFRLDYEYQAADKWLHPGLDPRTSQYDQTGIPTPRQSFTSHCPRLVAVRSEARLLRGVGMPVWSYCEVRGSRPGCSHLSAAWYS